MKTLMLKVIVIYQVQAQNTPLVDQLRLLQAQALGDNFQKFLGPFLSTVTLLQIFLRPPPVPRPPASLLLPPPPQVCSPSLPPCSTPCSPADQCSPPVCRTRHAVSTI